MTSDLIETIDGRVATLTMNRPDRRNAEGDGHPGGEEQRYGHGPAVESDLLPQAEAPLEHRTEAADQE